MNSKIEKIQEMIANLNKELQTQMNNFQAVRSNIDTINGAIQAYTASIKLLEANDGASGIESESGESH